MRHFTVRLALTASLASIFVQQSYANPGGFDDSLQSFDGIFQQTKMRPIGGTQEDPKKNPRSKSKSARKRKIKQVRGQGSIMDFLSPNPLESDLELSPVSQGDLPFPIFKDSPEAISNPNEEDSSSSLDSAITFSTPIVPSITELAAPFSDKTDTLNIERNAKIAKTKTKSNKRRQVQAAFSFDGDFVRKPDEFIQSKKHSTTLVLRTADDGFGGISITETFGGKAYVHFQSSERMYFQSVEDARTFVFNRVNEIRADQNKENAEREKEKRLAKAAKLKAQYDDIRRI
ncbi:MAG: hypothetical protein HOI80_04130 [Alphaproteobacteria bacterium]|jgi:hypothetical protein|nr:hypothetical protein [Alphaproteobacteria bacterium]MBT5390710.1 hypothetical protein [Alphaproteobacteria bacterium]MBT5654674.1 hypothetical protein [Alphaproteobacteria bacterium]